MNIRRPYWLAGMLLTAIYTFPQHPPNTHVIKSGPETVEWGYFDASARPIVTIQSGDIVELDTPLAGSKEMQSMGMPEELIRPEMRALEAVKDRSQSYGNILVGPVAVENAEPGDVLEVRILEIRVADNYAVNVFHPGGGTLPDEFPYPRARAVPLDRDRNVAVFAPGVEIPLAPFFGTMGVAPARMVGRIGDGPPGYYGGNLDNKDLVAGTTLYIPVQCKQALFSVGDGHAGQGGGEVDGTAIEAKLWGKFQFIVRKDMKLKWPRAETPEYYMTMGFDPDLNKAVQLAVHEMVDYLMKEHHLSADEAYMLCSMAVDLRVTQVVDGVKGVHALLPKKIFVQR
ncbi:MAG TPA: acetamidase/formamidase family protein [Terriglobales bacterium]|nr:acetamidase/formamidase family protein [Terriglobales bacterium]HXF13453.1 acetamidase/formamidase family protein [Terriglobales bacterium]